MMSRERHETPEPQFIRRGGDPTDGTDKIGFLRRSIAQFPCFFARREDFGPRGILGFRRRIHPRQGLQRRLLDPPWPIRFRANRGLYILVAAQFNRPRQAALGSQCHCVFPRRLFPDDAETGARVHKNQPFGRYS